MITINNLLEIGKTGLLAHKARMAVISHNIANVNTPGYHRQIVQLQTQPPISPFGSAYTHYFGTGVKIADVIRAYNQMTADVLRDQTANSAKHGQLAQALKDAEILLAGSEDANLNARLEEFWPAWQDVANNADSPAYRNILLQRTQALTAQFNNLADRLTQYRREILLGTGANASGSIARDVVDVNSLAERIADLNRRISIISLYGSNPNDLLDSRDILLNELAEITDIELIREDNNTYTILLDGQTLVSGRDYYTVSVADDGLGVNPIRLQIEDPGGGAPIDITPTEGRLGGWIAAAEAFEDLLEQLDVMAAVMVQEVNTLHFAGYDLDGVTGRNFFDPAGITAATISLDADILGQPERIAAAQELHTNPNPPPAELPNVGDGRVALEIASLCTQRLPGLNDRSFSNYFVNILTTLGVRITTESDLANDAHSVITSLQASISAQSGVNLDEEMVDMLSAQRAFAACSRVVTAADEMLDVIINRMGR